MKKWLCFTFVMLLCCSVSFSKDRITCHEARRTTYKCTSSDKSVSLSLAEVEKKLPSSREATFLDLSNARVNITSGCFSNFEKLHTLNLSKGGISQLPKGTLKGLKSLQTLDLSNNVLETLPSDFVDDLEHLNHSVTVYLHNNNWNCSCGSGLIEALQSRNDIIFGPVPVMCVHPEIMKQVRIDEGKCDVNECMEENDCDDEAECSNTVEDYACTCTTKGFKGSGKECIDIDECKGEHDCAKVGGKCINEHGKYRCECEGGFVGDGKTCKDIDECKTRDCGEDGECTNTVGSFRCDCDAGYMENKERICVDIDECKRKNHTCGAIKHSYCSNLKKLLPNDPGYECLCQSGYRKVGKSCVLEGNTSELVKILAMIIGGFLGSLFVIIICTVVCRKLRNREPEEEKKEDSTVVLAPAGGMPPAVEFAGLDMPQVDQKGQQAEEEWCELEEEEEDDDDDEDDDNDDEGH